MVRSQRQIDRGRERKREKAERYKVMAGRSVVQMLQEELDSKVNEYMDAKVNGVMPEARGRMRAKVDGIASGVGIICWPYMERNESCKMALQESLTRVRAERKKEEWLKSQV